MTRPVRVMHFADTHFGVELYGKLDPETGMNTRLLDFKRSLNLAIDRALDEDIDLAVFAGDAYKNRDPRQTEQREFADCVRRLTQAGVPVVLLVGNHDMPPIRGRANAVEIYRTLGVRHTHVFSKADIQILHTRVGPVRIAALPYLVKGYSIAREEFQGKTIDETRRLLEDKYVGYLQWFCNEIQNADDNIPTILCGHFWVSGAQLSSREQNYFGPGEPQVPLSALTAPQFDYVALGHIHKHQDLNRGQHPPVVYSGSPDRIDFGEKDEEKGFVLARVQKGAAEYEFVPLPESRPFIEITVDPVPGDDPTEQIVAAIKRHRLRNAVVRLSYSVPQGQQGEIREKEIREALGAAFMVAAIQRNVQRDRNARNSQLTDTLSAREALSLYIDTREDWRPQKSRLMEYAEPLFAEQEKEEVIA
ncbi:MAG: exonuclease SbcCD subunit D [Chloroherpetonaceae bacterium]|nr:exonuclease SbcCD subunit D [Chthonomonadaceae bacterium]MDW8208797.1 exonuclease SbcCD subunit D [Chloroherpetonaceae bacterium]